MGRQFTGPSFITLLLPNGLLLTFSGILVRLSLAPALIRGVSWEQECPYFLAPLEIDRLGLSLVLADVQWVTSV